MDEHHIAVGKTARYVTIGDRETASELWFVLHGYAQLAPRFIRRFEALKSDSRLIVAPEALNRYYFETSPGVHAHDAGIGATWMTREEREYEITDYVAYLDTLYHAITIGLANKPQRIVAFGFSQGAATAARWIQRGSAHVTDVMLCGGFLPPEIEPAAGVMKGASVYFVHGTNDPYASPEKIRQESDRLKAAGMPHIVVPFDGAHEVTDSAIREILRVSAAGT